MDTTHRDNVATAKADLAKALKGILDATTVGQREKALEACHAWIHSWGELLVKDAEILNEVVTEANVKGYTLEALKAQS